VLGDLIARRRCRPMPIKGQPDRLLVHHRLRLNPRAGGVDDY
jgi:hypothetical protein